MKTETLEYRGYELVVAHTPPLWQIAIYPKHPHQRHPHSSQQFHRNADKEKAIASAKLIIDELLN